MNSEQLITQATQNTYFFEKALENPQYFIVFIILGLVFSLIVPILFWHLYNSNKNNKELINVIREEMKQGFKRVSESVGKPIIDDNKTLISIGEKAMSASLLKLSAIIRARLIQNDIKNNPESIKNHLKSRIKDAVEDNSINHLNNFPTDVGLFGEWVDQNFEYDEYFDKVFKIFFDEKFSIDKKVELCESVFNDCKSKMWSDFKLIINK